MKRKKINDRRLITGKQVEMTVLNNPSRCERIYQVVDDLEGVITPIGKCLESQVVYPIFAPTQRDSIELGYVLMDGTGLYCYDASGGEAVFMASAQTVMLANYDPINARIPFQLKDFSGLMVAGLLGCVWDGKVVPFVEIADGQEIITDSLAFTFVASGNGDETKIGVCPTEWVDKKQLASANGDFLQPIWNSAAFEEEFFNVDNARLLALLVR